MKMTLLRLCPECVDQTSKCVQILHLLPIVRINRQQVPNQLETPGGAKTFWEGPKFFELCPIVLNYVQQIFPRGTKKFLGGA